jgi:SpoVK/Ycf46/Vps4 family AAA+-type ATPase
MSKRFVDVLDSYNKKKNCSSTDYSLLVSIINDDFNNNKLSDKNMIGSAFNIITHQSDNGALFDDSKQFYNIMSEPYFLLDPYTLWQKRHETMVELLLREQIKPDASNNIDVKFTCKKNIDTIVTSLNDLINIIENNEYRPDTEYNIDLKSLHNIKTELISLNSMIGMENMKQSIIDQLMYFIQNLHLGKESGDFKHTAIYGPPGTGKTEIAKIIGRMYSKMGILKNNVFKKVTRSDLIGGYLGQTAIKTRKVIEECMGGVLFIDEAYSLANGEREDSYSKECLDTLCEALSDHKNDLMVIIAGYEDELNETFFRVNKGLQSRFIWRFTMDEYSSIEMMKIFKKKVLDQEWSFENEDHIKERWFIDKKDNFKAYGRDMELLFTYTKVCHGRRIYGKDKDIKKKISIEDLDKGYEIFIKNKNIKKENRVPYGLYT